MQSNLKKQTHVSMHTNAKMQKCTKYTWDHMQIVVTQYGLGFLWFSP